MERLCNVTRFQLSLGARRSKNLIYGYIPFRDLTYNEGSRVPVCSDLEKEPFFASERLPRPHWRNADYVISQMEVKEYYSSDSWAAVGVSLNLFLWKVQH